MPKLPAGTVTLLFTDVEGSTRLLHEVGDRYAALLADHRRVVREVIASRGGFEVDTAGDSFFVAFPDAGDAVTAAAEIQEKLARGPIKLRMGLHTGEPTPTEEGYVGIDVHRAARIAAAGHGGQVLLSAATQRLVDQQVADLGLHRLKDLVAPERIFQLGDGEFGPIKSLDQTNLPIQPTAFLGRASEVAEILGLLARQDVRLLTLTGAGGSGKTRLAIQAASELVGSYPDGVWFVGLASVTDPQLVAATIALTIGVREQPGESLLLTLARHLRGKRMLLLIDNVEQLLPDAAAPLGELALSSPGVRLLVASREPLRVSAEREYPVDPLSMAEAVEFFVRRAQAVRPEFDLDDEKRASIEAICTRLDRLPLAIELAAARVKLLAPDAVLARLERRLSLLVGGARDAPERHRTLRATIEWSHDLLSADERLLFARLAMFSGGCTLEAAERVCDAQIETLASLVDKSLLRAGDGIEDLRYQMLETVREFALEQMDEGPDGEEIRRRHAEHFLALAEAASNELKGRDQQRWLQQLEREQDNLRGALGWLLERGDPADALRLSAALWLFWYMHGHISEGRRWLASALDRAEDTQSEAMATALDGAGYLAGEQGDPAARGLLEASLRCAREIDAPAHAAIAASHLSAFVLEDGGEPARALGQEAVALARAAHDRYTLAVALNNLGEVERYMGDPALATKLYQESYEIRREIGDASRIALSLSNLGEMALLANDLERARSLLSEGVALARELGDKRNECFGLDSLGWTELLAGHVEESEQFFREALVLSRDVGLLLTSLDLVKGLSGVAAGRADVVRAARLDGAVTALEEVIGKLPTSVAESGAHLDLLEALRVRSDPAIWEAARKEGSAMGANEAIEYALGDD